MKSQKVAVLITCHNRKAKTLACLASLFEAKLPSGYELDVFLMDDGCTDGTGNTVKRLYPQISILKGNGYLFWAGGMRLAWETAMEKQSYDVYLLINDDVRLFADFMDNLIATERYSLTKSGKKGIYSGATIDEETNKTTYGGARIKTNHFVMRSQLLNPTQSPQACEITNANILWISRDVVDRIGIFDAYYTHGIADYDYSLRAVKKNIPVYLAPNICGICADDHGKNWKSCQVSLPKRIAYLKSPKGLAYNEYMHYIRKHFPLFVPYSFIMLWMKTFFPFLWSQFKKK